MDAHDGLPKIVQVFPVDNCKRDTTVDIIAVHGIETCSPKTWIAYEQDVEPRGRATNWLCDEDMLPKTIPEGRIWVYNYNANCYSDKAQEVDILGLGESFLEVLWIAKDKDIGKRPLIFVGSCFGGIVVAQALERAYRNQAKYAGLLQSAVGVIFLGTPLRGTSVASIAQWIAIVHGLMGKETSRTLLKGLDEKGATLDTVIHDFAEIAILYKLRIRCFYETRETQILNAVTNRWIAGLFSKIKIVPKEAACLDGHRRIPLDARHAMMNKFRGPDDGNFLLVSGCLKELVDNSRTSQSRTPEELECLQCFTSDYIGDKDRNGRRVPGTCEWFVKNRLSVEWRREDTALLLVTADPGCGKSVLAKALVDEDLLGSDTDLGDTSICYFFFKDDNASQQSAADALCAILHQLFVQKPALLKYALSEFHSHGKHICTMFGILWGVLEKAASSSEAGQIVCVLDALDECCEIARRDLIARLCHFYCNRDRLNAKMKFLVTSRPYSDIERAFQEDIPDMTSISLRGEDETEKISKEIDLVIDDRIPHICTNRRYPLKPEVHDALIKQLKSIPHRTYLWLHLIFDAIQKSLDSTKTSLERLIKKIPRTVEDAYEKILARIHSSDLARQARRLLHMIVAAERPLSVQELSIALAMDDKLARGETCQSYEELDVQPDGPFREKIRNCCGLFVSVIDSKVYLLHQTAKEFLISEQAGDISKSNFWQHSLKPAESNSIILNVCISYLLLEEFERENVAEDKPERHCIRHGQDLILWEDDHRGYRSLEGNAILESLLDYATEYWPSHVRKVEIAGSEPLLQSTLKLCDALSNRFRDCYHVRTHYFLDYPRRKPNKLLIASYHGLDALVRLILEKDVIELGSRDHLGNTLLPLATHEGHLKDVRLRLRRVKDSVELNETALRSAATYEYSNVAKLPLERHGIEVNTADARSKRAPLTHATINEDPEAVELLLTKEGLDLNAVDWRGQSALGVAIDRGHHKVVKLLLHKSGVDRNLKDGSGKTPLALAASAGYPSIVKLLVSQTDVELNTQDYEAQTPLTQALCDGDSDIAKLLLETHGVDFNFKNSYGITPLMVAAHTGQREVVRLLLKKEGIEVDARDQDDRTALSLAVQAEDYNVVKLLLDTGGVEPNHKDVNGHWIIIKAAKRGNPGIVRLLLEWGVDVNVQDRKGWTPLMLARKYGRKKVVKLLQEFLSFVADQRSADIVTEENLPPSKRYRMPARSLRRSRRLEMKKIFSAE